MQAAEFGGPSAADRAAGIPAQYWPALLTFAAHSSVERDALHGLAGKGGAGKPSPFADLASYVGGWRLLKNWELSLDAHNNIIDKSGRKVVPLECFDFFIFAAALDVFSKHEHVDSRISPTAILAALAAENISAGSLLGHGGRPPIFSISSRCVVHLLGADALRLPADASSPTCAVDAALNNLSSARSRLESPLLRRFLSFHPLSWPTAVLDSIVIDEFRTGTRRSIVWSGPSPTYMRRKFESIASLVEVCMAHTNSYEARASGARYDVYRCHRREKPKAGKVWTVSHSWCSYGVG